MVQPPEGRSAVSAVALGGAATVVGVLPHFLTGAMAVQISQDLRFGAAGLGLAVAAFRMTQILTSAPLGRLADRLGATRSMRLAALVSLLASIGIATSANGLPALSAWMAFASCANALGQPAANRMLIHRVPSSRLGFAFGLKQSAAPVASMLAGFAVPAVATTIGWRWAYVGAGAIATVVIAAAGARPTTAPAATAGQRSTGASTQRLAHRRLVVLMSAAFGFALAGNAVVTTFFVSAATEAGVAPSVAGTYLAFGSLSAIAVRLLAGQACDRIIRRPLLLAAGMIGVGSMGILLLATMRPGAMLPGVMLAMGGAWGFNGVFWYALVTAYPATPGRITGAMSPGGFTGSTVGTLTFGAVAEQLGYATAWTAAAVIALIGSATIGLVGSALIGSRPRAISE